MTWTLDNAFPRMVAHLSRLAMTPGWKGQVAFTIAELEADQSGIWMGIRQAVNDAVKAAKAAKSGPAKAPESEPPQPGKSL